MTLAKQLMDSMSRQSIKQEFVRLGITAGQFEESYINEILEISQSVSIIEACTVWFKENYYMTDYVFGKAGEVT